MKEMLELLKNPTFLGLLALAILGLIYILRSGIDFWKSTVLPIIYQAYLQRRRIVLPKARKVLDAEWGEPEFFRDGDPKFVDFRNERIFPRPELLTIEAKLAKGRFLHLEGPPSCGKTVLAFNIAYKHLQERTEVLYFSRPSSLPKAFLEFLATPAAARWLDRPSVLIVVDDVHLDVPLCSRLFSFIHNNFDNCRLLYVSRSLQMEYDWGDEGWQYSFTDYMPNLEIRSDAVVEPLANFFSMKKFATLMPPAVRTAILTECGPDLLILGRYLREWNGLPNVHLPAIRSKVFDTVRCDLELLRTKTPDAIKILLVIGVFYRFEVPVERRFLEAECGYLVDPLIKSYRELKEHNDFVMLHHSSLAKLYANVIQKLNMREYLELSEEFNPFPQKLFKAYTLSEPRNFCELVIGLRRKFEQ